jgi:hypothetical protein
MAGDKLTNDFTIISPSSIQITAPAHVAATVNVTVHSDYGSSCTSPTDDYTYMLPPPPTVTTVFPISELTTGGNTATITGTNFTGATLVTFSNEPTKVFTVVSHTIIDVIAPANATVPV